MKNIKRIAVAVVVALGLVAVWAGWGAVNVGAVPPDDSGHIAFGMVGITAGQTARLNVVYVPPDSGDKKASDPEWIVRLQFLDDMGRVVAEKTVRLMPGQSAYLDFAFDIFRDAPRLQIRGFGVPCNKGTHLGTVEVFDNATGQTQFVLPGTHVGGPSPHQ